MKKIEPLTSERVRVGMSVLDSEDNVGKILDCKDPHNVHVKYQREGSGLYCLIEGCCEKHKFSDQEHCIGMYDPLYYDEEGSLCDFRNIAETYGIRELIKVKRGDQFCLANGEESYVNKSYLIGKDTIYLGIYEDEELLTASFFHELGHIVDSKEGFVNSEAKAWHIGFKLAKEHGHEFSQKTYLWAIEQMSTYD